MIRSSSFLLVALFFLLLTSTLANATITAEMTAQHRLRSLAVAVYTYAIEHDKFPDTLEDLRSILGSEFDLTITNPRNGLKPGYIYIKPRISFEQYQLDNANIDNEPLFVEAVEYGYSSLGLATQTFPEDTHRQAPVLASSNQYPLIVVFAGIAIGILVGHGLSWWNRSDELAQNVSSDEK